MLKCIHCENIFKPNRTNNKNPKKYCSKICYKESKKSKKFFHPCAYCGKDTLNPRFCNNSCSASFNNKGKRRHSKPDAPWSLVKLCKTCGKETPRPVYCSDECNPKRKLHLTSEEKHRLYRARMNESWARYMAKRKNQTPKDADIKAIQQFYANCPEGYEVDHIIPLSKGGLHTLENLQYLTISENRKKSNKIMA
jgi:hypothetical protein